MMMLTVCWHLNNALKTARVLMFAAAESAVQTQIITKNKLAALSINSWTVEPNTRSSRALIILVPMCSWSVVNNFKGGSMIVSLTAKPGGHES